MRIAQFTAGILLLIALEVARVYFIMPFPGSQHAATIDLAYYLHTNILWFRLIGLLLILYPVIQYLQRGSLRQKVVTGVVLVAYGVVFYLFNFKFLADKMFYQPEQKTFAAVGDKQNLVPDANLVLGVSLHGQARAYPIELIGYHHQVRDEIGGTPVMVTYCTVCRTGRVFSPEVKGKPEQFRLVGMDHFNAMFEDATTGSWWRQVNGEAIAGPLQGTQLREIPSEQMSLASWRQQYPETTVLQADSTFKKQLKAMRHYDEGKGGELTGRDSLSWKEKSWVVGVQIGTRARAYDWNHLVQQRVINDTLARVPIVIELANDSTSFRAYRRDLLQFQYDTALHVPVDAGTRSVWGWDGVCKSGALTGQRLPLIQSYQEFWHSWRTFRPGTTVYKAE
jgi:hypothetical protein